MKALWPLIDPATWLGLILLAAAVLPWLRRSRSRWARLLPLAPLLLFALTTMPPVPELLQRRLALPEAAREPDPGSGDYLVVLGGGARLDGRPTKISFLRTATAVRLWRRQVAPRLLFTGRDAPGMAQLAREFGVPGEAILLDPRSRSTRENALGCAAILSEEWSLRPEEPPPRIILVTSPEHLRRAVRTFRRIGLPAIPAPAPFPLQARAPSAAPTFGRAATLSRVLYEEAALLAYRWRGWI